MKLKYFILALTATLLTLPGLAGCSFITGASTQPEAPPTVTKTLPPVQPPSSTGPSQTPSTTRFTPPTSVGTPTPVPPPPIPSARKDVSVAEASALIEANRDNPDFVVLDVRTPPEYAAGHIENSVNVDFEAAGFQDEVGKLDRNRTYLVYCRTGVRSAGASDIMVGLGFTGIYNMTGGIMDWQAAGFPVVQ